MKIKILPFFLLFLFFQLQSQTIIPDLSMVSGNWALSGSPYIVQGRATVPTGQILTIVAGVQVKFTSSTNYSTSLTWDADTNIVGRLKVDGKIIANGTITDTILFCGNNSGSWGSVYLSSSADTSSSFKYCKFTGMNGLFKNNTSGGPNIYDGLYSFSKIHLSNLLFQKNIISVSGNNMTIISSKFRLNNYTTRDWGNFTFNNCLFDSSQIFVMGKTIITNSIIENASKGIFSDGFGSKSYIINSLFYNNHNAICSTQNYSFPENELYFIYNCIFLNNDTDFVFHDGDTCLIGISIFNNSMNMYNTSNAFITLLNNFTNTNPNLISPAPINGDFHLQPSSACINNGDTTGISALIPTTDLDENPRYNNAIDIGPYEYQGNNSINQIELNHETNIFVYPNPTSNTLSLNTDNVSNYQNSTITIQNTLGQTVKKLSFAKNIDVSDLSQGCYFLQITLSNGETYKTKFIKQ